MENTFNNVSRQRAGITLRDSTPGGGESLQKGFRISNMRFGIVARGLMFASMGLGLVELLAPRFVQKLVGVKKGDYTRLIRFYGLRELNSAMLILMQPRPEKAVWSRVAGDAMDLVTLGAGFDLPRVDKKRLTGAMAFVGAVTALDVLTAVMLRRESGEARVESTLTKEDLNHRARSGAFHVSRSVTIGASPAELYTFWRNFENLPRFMYHLEEVRVLDERRSHWVAKAPAGMRVDWDGEITEDRPNERIAWRSLPGVDVQNSGVVTFEPAPQNQGTVVRVEIDYRPPAGAIGRAVAKLFGESPSQQVAGDLRRLKQVIEIGEVVRSEGTPQGYGQKMQSPAKPDPNKNVERMPRLTPEQQREQFTARNTGP